MKKHGKKFRAVAEKVGKNQAYSLKEAISLAIETSPVKFDATVEIHVNTGTNPKHADQMIRATVALPNGTGKSQRIAVFCDETKTAEAKKAGADLIGEDDLINEVLSGKIDFDIAIAQTSLMKKLAKIAKVLGPKGLMPSPKSGTVTDDIGRVVGEIKKGKIEFRNDKEGIVHSILGKVSFGENKILENTKSFLKALKDAKPEGIKSNYIKKISITTSMGPGIMVDIQEALKEA